MSSKCYWSIACWLHSTYKEKTSKTYQANGTIFEVNYGSGGIKGTVSNDIVNFGGIDVPKQDFGEITKLSGISFIVARLDGILGLGWDTISMLHIPPIFEVMAQQGLIDDASFSFYLTKAPGAAGSKLILGGVDSKYYTGDFNYYPLAAENYWLIGMNDFVVNGTSYKAENMVGIVDSGTSVFVGPTAAINEIKKGFPALINCTLIETYPTIQITLGTDVYNLEPSDYILKETLAGQSECILGLIGMDIPRMPNAWILGDLFMKKYYTHFDMAGKRVGFATSVAPSHITSE